MSDACCNATGLGGTCLNRGCIPSKMLIHPADLMAEINHEASRLNLKVHSDVTVDFEKLVRTGASVRFSLIPDGDSGVSCSGCAFNAGAVSTPPSARGVAVLCRNIFGVATSRTVSQPAVLICDRARRADREHRVVATEVRVRALCAPRLLECLPLSTRIAPPFCQGTNRRPPRVGACERVRAGACEQGCVGACACLRTSMWMCVRACGLASPGAATMPHANRSHTR